MSYQDCDGDGLDMIHWIIAGFCWPRNTFSGGSDKRYQKGYSGKHSAKPNICIKERLIDNRHHCQCDFHVASLSVCKDVAPNWGLSQPSPWPMAAKRSPASSVSSGYTNSFIIKVSRWSMLSIISFNTTAFDDDGNTDLDDQQVDRIEAPPPPSLPLPAPPPSCPPGGKT